MLASRRFLVFGGPPEDFGVTTTCVTSRNARFAVWLCLVAFDLFSDDFVRDLQSYRYLNSRLRAWPCNLCIPTWSVQHQASSVTSERPSQISYVRR